jgi:hypothetical protein
MPCKHANTHPLKFIPEDGFDMFLRNGGIYLPINATTPLSSLQCERQISQNLAAFRISSA